MHHRVRARTFVRIVLPLSCCALVACGSGDGFGGGIPLQPTFDSIQANVFEPLCEHCHAGANAPQGLRLDAANSYASLVGVPSTEVSSLLRVAPGNPNASYLIQKLEGTASVGERMPAGLPAVPQQVIDVVRRWIADGALPGSASAGPVRVTSVSPAPGSTLLALPASITVGFDRDLNVPSVTTATFTLRRAGPDGALGTADDVAITPASVSVPSANARSAVMNLTGVASVFDTYRITLVGTPPAAILDLGGNALDGEPVQLPSGNGTAGGDYTATLIVAGTLPTLTSIQTNVFTPRCAGCHNGSGATLPGAMNLTSATTSLAALVNIASVETPSLVRVAPGNPSDSYLIRKLEGTPGIVGGRMPLNSAPLDQTTINSIRSWITNGAAP